MAADPIEIQEYAASIAAGTVELVEITNRVRDALTAALDSDDDCAVAIAGAKETRDALIRDAYRIGLAPFMHPHEAAGEDETAAGSGDKAAGGRGRR